MRYKVGDEPVPGYCLVRPLGNGSFGQVWKAKGPGGTEVALKILSLENRGGEKEFKALRLMKSIRDGTLTPISAFWLKDEDGSLLDEAQVAGDFTDSVRPVVGALEGTVLLDNINRSRPRELIIAMGLGDKTLADRLKEHQAQGSAGIPPKELFRYMEDAARAIDFLNSPQHDLGKGPISPIQHLDIKPANILIVGRGAQVCDFGLAREFGGNIKMTSAGCTVAYAAPEVLDQKPTSASDQYSLAITYVELRTGRLPFTDPESYAHVMNAHLQGKLDLSGLAPQEAEIILKATSRDPTQRYETALRMIKYLKKAVRSESPEDFDSDSVNEPFPPRGSGVLNETLVLPGSQFPKGGSTVHDRISTSTKDTPILKGHDTTRDSARLGRTVADLLAAPAHSSRRRVAKWVVALLLLVGVGFGVREVLRVIGEVRIYAAARQDYDTAQDESGLVRKAELLNKVIEQCAPYSSTAEFADLAEKAKTARLAVEDTAVKAAGDKLEAAKTDIAYKEVIDYCDQFGEVFPSAGDEPTELGKIRDKAERFRDDLASGQQKENAQKAMGLVDAQEKVLDRRPPADKADDLMAARQAFAEAETLVSARTLPDVVFRARLGAARADAQLGRPASEEHARQLSKELQELTATMPGDTRLERYAAQLIVLQALAVEPSPEKPGEALRKPMIQLDELQPDKSDGLWRLLNKDEWEYNQTQRLLDRAAKATDDVAVANVLKRFRPPVVATPAELLQTAETQWQGKQWEPLTKTLEQAAQVGAEGATKQKLSELEYLLCLANPDSGAEKTKKALEELGSRADASSIFRRESPTSTPADLCWVLDELTARDGQFSQDSIGLLKRVRDRYPQPRINDALRKLHDRRVSEQIQSAGPTSDRKQYFEALNRLCAEALADNVKDRLVNLAQAESRAELAGGVLSPDDRIELDALVASDKMPRTPPDQQIYEKYVRLLLRQKSAGKLSESATDLAELIAGARKLDGAEKDKIAFGFAVSHRRQGLAKLVIDAADGLREPIDVDKPNLAAIMQPYGADGTTKAKAAFEWLQHVKDLDLEVRSDNAFGPKLFANLALALWYKQPAGRRPSDDEVRSVRKAVELAIAKDASGEEGLSAGVMKSPDRLPILYLRSKVAGETLADRIGALESMDAILGVIVNATTKPEDKDVLALYSESVGPLVAAAAKLPDRDEQLSKRLAGLSFRSGKLIEEYRTADWPFDRKQGKYDAFDLAVSRDPKSADFRAARGFAALDLEPPKIDTALGDADVAIRLNPDAHGSHGLLAKAKLADARRKSDRNQQKELTEVAVAEGLRAVDLATNDTLSRVTYLYQLGDSLVALANCVDALYFDPRTNKPRSALLKMAIDKVKEAQRLNKDNWYSDYGSIIVGNAYEDLAWLVKEDVSANYDRAIEAFSAAVEQAPDAALPLMNRGRCYYKREVDSDQPGFIDKAKADLTEAIRLRSDFAEAERWLGAVYQFQADFDAADLHFRKAMDFAEKNSPNYRSYSVLWAKVRLNDPKSQQSKVRERVDRLLDEAGNDKNYLQRLALVVGRSYEIENHWDEALALYDKGMPSDVDKIDASEIDLLRARAQLLLDKEGRRAAADKNRRRTIEDCKAAVRDWDRVIQLSGALPDGHDLHDCALASTLYWQFAVATSPQENHEKLLEKAIENYDRAVANAPHEVRSKELLADYATLLIKYVLGNPEAVKQLTPNAKRLVKGAPTLLQNKIKKLGLNNRVSSAFIEREVRLVKEEIAKAKI